MKTTNTTAIIALLTIAACGEGIAQQGGPSSDGVASNANGIKTVIQCDSTPANYNAVHFKAAIETDGDKFIDATFQTCASTFYAAGDTTPEAASFEAQTPAVKMALSSDMKTLTITCFQSGCNSTTGNQGTYPPLADTWTIDCNQTTY